MKGLAGLFVARPALGYVLLASLVVLIPLTGHEGSIGVYLGYAVAACLYPSTRDEQRVS